MQARVGARYMRFKDKDRNNMDPWFDLFTNMFAEHPSGELEIEEGKELVGFAVAVDEHGNPCWLDFVIAGGGQWQYREGETCEHYHPLKYINELLNSKEGSVDCNLCKVQIKNPNHGYFRCQESCNYNCCINCFNHSKVFQFNS